MLQHEVHEEMIFNHVQLIWCEMGDAHFLTAFCARTLARFLRFARRRRFHFIAVRPYSKNMSAYTSWPCVPPTRWLSQ